MRHTEVTSESIGKMIKAAQIRRFTTLEKVASGNYRNRVEIHAFKNVNGEPHVLAAYQNGEYVFPGGGVEDGQSIRRAAQNEMAEEAGYKLKKVKQFGKAQRYQMSEKWREKAIAKRGKSYLGVNNHVIQAELGDVDKSAYGREGDEISGLRLHPVREVQAHMRREADKAEMWYASDDWRSRAKRTNESLLTKVSERQRDYRKEYLRDHASPKAKRHRAMRNLWNRRMKGEVPAGYEIDHKKPLARGGSNDRSNIRLMRVSKNRAEHNRGAEKMASRFLMVRGSTGGDESVSTSLAYEYEKQLRALGHKVDTVDLKNVPYADEWNAKYQKKQKGLMRKADGVIFSSPVYNWGPSARVSAYMQQAVKSGNNPYLPYVVLGAAGSTRAAGSLDAFSQSIAREDKGISIGAPIIGTYDDMDMSGDKVRGIKSKSLRDRIGQNARVLAAVAKARRNMRKHAGIKEAALREESGTAVKRDPAKWEAAKQQAKAKMGGKHSARAMQLAVQIYKKSGGTYEGGKPSASTNKMKKWTKQKWRTRPGTSSVAQRSDGSTARYLPEKKWEGMSKKEQIKTDVAKLKERKQYVANTERAKVRSKFKYY